MADIDIMGDGYDSRTRFRGSPYDEGITRVLFAMRAETARDSFSASDIATFLEKTEQRIPVEQRHTHPLWGQIFSGTFHGNMDSRLMDVARRTGFVADTQDGSYTPTFLGLLHTGAMKIAEPYASAAQQTIAEIYPKAP